MGIITAKQLKQRTGEIIKRIKSGERLTLTYRGRPVAVITPSGKDDIESMNDLRPLDTAWDGIETALKKTEPEFKGWKEAARWARERS